MRKKLLNLVRMTIEHDRLYKNQKLTEAREKGEVWKTIQLSPEAYFEIVSKFIKDPDSFTKCTGVLMAALSFLALPFDALVDSAWALHNKVEINHQKTKAQKK